jgi:glutathionylspermidine synthase
MQRQSFSPRPRWQEKVEEIGLTYHTHETGPYWDESAFYELTAREVDELEGAANSLHQLCIEAAEAVVENNWWSRLAIPDAAVPVIVESWEKDDFSVYGRFDFAYDGKSPPVLLEYNADTPTALIEASVAQWFWLQDSFKGADQFNSIHERLIEAWKRLGKDNVHFTSISDFPEDEQTVAYLQDTAHQADVKTVRTPLEEIGWNEDRECFVDQHDKEITTCFKLYPWEWMWREEFSQHLGKGAAQFIEPPWKMLLSNKGLLPILWELFPKQPNLLPCYETPEPLGESFVKKPKLGREGSNVTLVECGQTVQTTGGDYGVEGFVYQAVARLPDFGGHYPVLGVWVVDHEAAGLGIREDDGRITGNLSRFVPHLFQPR